MSRALIAAQYPTCGYDLRPEARAELESSGERSCDAAGAVVAWSDVIITSLPSAEAFVKVAEETLAPAARARQIFIEMGTSVPEAVRRMATAFAARGAHFLDVPVFGGRTGAENRRLRMFAGGDPRVLNQVRPILTAIGGDTLFHCGPVGMGSVIKGVNQLKMGLSAAIHLEILALAVREGLDPALVDIVFGNDWNMHFSPLPRAVAEERAQFIGVKFRELPTTFVSPARAPKLFP